MVLLFSYSISHVIFNKLGVITLLLSILILEILILLKIIKDFQDIKFYTINKFAS